MHPIGKEYTVDGFKEAISKGDVVPRRRGGPEKALRIGYADGRKVTIPFAGIGNNLLFSALIHDECEYQDIRKRVCNHTHTPALDFLNLKEVLIDLRKVKSIKDLEMSFEKAKAQRIASLLRKLHIPSVVAEIIEDYISFTQTEELRPPPILAEPRTSKKRKKFS